MMASDSAGRKKAPMARGLIDYFPAALEEVAKLSLYANEKHNPGEEMHHSRGKSWDHADCIIRHLVDRGEEDDDGFLHEVKVAWRALALLQEELEARGAPLTRAARLTPRPRALYDPTREAPLSDGPPPPSSPKGPGVSSYVTGYSERQIRKALEYSPFLPR